MSLDAQAPADSCPTCKTQGEVIDSRQRETARYRRRKCSCGYRWSTMEVTEGEYQARRIRVVDALMSASSDDLELIDVKLTELEREFEVLASEYKSKIESLKAARRFVSLKLGEAPVKAARSSRKKTAVRFSPVLVASPESELDGNQLSETVASEIANRVFDLVQSEGSMPLPAIAASLKLPAAEINSAISHASVSGWFEKQDGEIHVAYSGTAL